MAKTNDTSPPHRVNPLWALLALPSMLLLLGSDAGNNLSIVHRFATGELSLWSWQGLALGAAIASAPIGYATSFKRWLIIPCGVVCLLGGILTVMSTNTDFAARSAGAGKYQSDYHALNSERTALLKSLNPTDGTLPCKKQRWCDSQAKERRLAEINTMTASQTVEVDPLAVAGGPILAQIIAYLRAFGVPVVVASLGHILGLMFQGGFRKKKSATGPASGGKSPEKKPEQARKSGPETSRNLGDENEEKYSESKAEVSVKQAVERSVKWLADQPTGRIKKTELKVKSRAKGQKAMALVVEELLDRGALIRYDNGQLGKPESRALRVVGAN